MKDINRIEFLTKEEVETLKQSDLTKRQIAVLDIMRSWSETKRDNDGFFILTTRQIATELGVSDRTVERDITTLKCKRFVAYKKMSVNGIKHQVNAYKLNLYHDSVGDSRSDTIYDNTIIGDNKMSHSNSNTIYNNYTNTNTKTNTSISMRQDTTNMIHFEFENFVIDFNFSSIEELDQIAEKAIEIDRKIKQYRVGSVEEAKTNKQEISQNPTNNPNSISDRLGKVWDEIDSEIQELKNKPLTVATELLCVGDNHYPQLVNVFKDFIKENSQRMSSKQLDLCNTKLKALENCIAKKIENCNKYANKSLEEVEHIKFIDNLTKLGERLGRSKSEREYIGNVQKLSEWIAKQQEDGVCKDSDEEVINKVVLDANKAFRENNPQINFYAMVDAYENGASLDDWGTNASLVSPFGEEIELASMAESSTTDYPFS